MPTRARTAMKSTASLDAQEAAALELENERLAEANRVQALEIARLTQANARLAEFQVPIYDEGGRQVGSTLLTPPAKRTRVCGSLPSSSSPSYSSGDSAGGEGSHDGGLRALAAMTSSMTTVKKERDEARDSEESANMILFGEGGMQEQHGAMKKVCVDVQRALLEAGCPKKQKSDTDPAVPFYYSVGGSYSSRGQVPWNGALKRAMTPAEGVEWLATNRSR